MVMKITFILISLLILEQATGKKRVVIHVPNKINNIHHHHVKKVIVYKPVPVKCHHNHEGNKHDWTGGQEAEAWDETQKDEWVDKRPIIAQPASAAAVAVSLKTHASPISPSSLHPSPWGDRDREIIKGGYMSGERISSPPSDSWDAPTIRHLKTSLTTADDGGGGEDEEEEDEGPGMRRPASSSGLIRRPSSSASANPSGWKQAWTSNDVIRVTEPSVLIQASPVRGKKHSDAIKTQQTLISKPPKEHYVTYKVVKKKVTKQRAKKKPTVSPPVETLINDEHRFSQTQNWNGGLSDSQPNGIKIKSPRPKPNVQSHYGGTEIIKSNSYYVPAVQSSATSYDQELYASSSSLRPQWSQDYYNNGAVSNKPYYDNYITSSIRPYSQDVYGQSSGSAYGQPAGSNTYGQSGGNAYDQYPFNSNTYNSYNPGNLYNTAAGTTYTTGTGIGGAGVIKSDQDAFSFNSHKIKALLDQNVQTTVNVKRQKPTYDLNVHGHNKVKSDSSSYQMRYQHLNSSTPTAFLINHRSMNLSKSGSKSKA